MGQITENKGNDISKKQLADILNKQFRTVNENDIPDEVSNEHDIILTTTDERYKINLSEIYNGKFSGNIGTTQFELAKDKLLLASEDGEKSPYVNYKYSVDENPILCRVLYNDETHGLEIVSANPITTITLGMNDIKVPSTITDGLEKTKWSYNNAIETLNKKAEEYLNTKFADRARCIGSNPINPNSESENFTFPNNYSSTAKSNEIKDKDENYNSDKTQLDELGIEKITDTTISSYYLLASRYAGHYSSEYYDLCGFSIYRVDSSGTMSGNSLFSIKSDGYPQNYTSSVDGFRPVFRLKAGVKITGGDGKTAESAYTLGL